MTNAKKVNGKNKHGVYSVTNQLIAQHAQNVAERFDKSLHDMSDIACEHCKNEAIISICMHSVEKRNELLYSDNIVLSEAQRLHLYSERDNFILQAAEAVKALAYTERC